MAAAPVFKVHLLSDSASRSPLHLATSRLPSLQAPAGGRPGCSKSSSCPTRSSATSAPRSRRPKPSRLSTRSARCVALLPRSSPPLTSDAVAHHPVGGGRQDPDTGRVWRCLPVSPFSSPAHQAAAIAQYIVEKYGNGRLAGRPDQRMRCAGGVDRLLPRVTASADTSTSSSTRPARSRPSPPSSFS
jgi:hypothetical protein